MNALLCLCIIQSFTGHNAHIPEQVDELVKARVVQQIKARRPDLEVTFGVSTCPTRVNYFYTADSLILESKNELWNGRSAISLTDLIDGKSVELHPLQTLADLNSSMKAEAFAAGSSLKNKESAPRRRWLPWAAITLGAVIVGALVSRNRGRDDSPAAPPPPPQPYPSERLPKKVRH